MNTVFQIVALDASLFSSFLSMSASELKRNHAKWIIADAEPGYPCRISLQDAHVGERVLLSPFNHLNTSSPYRASGPVFIRQHAVTANPPVNHVPKMLHHRQMSLRAYDKNAMMLAADVVPGSALKEGIQKLFLQQDIDFIHIHNAGPGCFNCAVIRA